MLELSPVNNSQIITLINDFLGSLNKDQFHSQEAFQFIEKHNKSLASLLDDYKVAGFIRYNALAYPLGRNMFSQTSSENSRVHIKDLIIKIFKDHKKPMRKNRLTDMVNEIRPVKAELQIAYPELTALGRGYYCLSSWKTNVVHNGIYFQIDDNHKEEFLEFSDEKDTPFKIWTEEEIEKILKLDDEGLPTTSIAEEMKLGHTVVYNAIRKYRKNSKGEQEIENGKTSKWTPSRVNKLYKMWREGNSAQKIADALGETTRNAVIGKIYRLGLSNRVDDRENNKDFEIIKSSTKADEIEENSTYSNWTELDIKKLKKLNEFNYSFKNLANILSKEEDDIINKLNELNLQ